MNWEELMSSTTKNVEYWASYVSRRTSLDKEDVGQDLLIIIWREYCRRSAAGKPVTRYFLQERLRYAALRTMTQFYAKKSVQKLELFILEGFETIDDRWEDSERRKAVNEALDELVAEYHAKGEERTCLIIELVRVGTKNKDIAEFLEIGEGNLSVLIRRKIKNPLEEKLCEIE